jgi:hypothetical protein
MIMNFLKHIFLFLFITISVHGFTQEELVDSAFTYFRDRIITIDENGINTIIQEIDYLSNRDKLDKNLVIQQLTDRIQTQAHYHAKSGRNKLYHPALLKTLACVAAGAGFLGLTYWIYKKWDAPINVEFDSITQNLKQYGVSVREDTYDTYISHRHVIHNHIIKYNYSRRLANVEDNIVRASLDQLLALRKRQSNIRGFEGAGLLGALLSPIFGSGCAIELYTSNPDDHKLRYEKYQFILQKLASA